MSSRGTRRAPDDWFWDDTANEVSGTGYTCGGERYASKSTRAEQHRARADDARRLVQNGWYYHGKVRPRTCLQMLKHEFLAGVYGAMPDGGGLVFAPVDVVWTTATISITLFGESGGNAA